MKKVRTYKQKKGDAKKRFKTETIMRKFLIDSNPECFIQPIESHITGIGIPDLFVSIHPGFNIWAELKTIKRKVSNIVSPDWRPGQMSWAKRYQKKGGDWILLISINDILYYTNIVSEKYMLDELISFNSFRDKDFVEHIADY